MLRRAISLTGLALVALALVAPDALASGTLTVSKRASDASPVGDEAGTVTGTYTDEDPAGGNDPVGVTAIDCGTNCSQFIPNDEGVCPDDGDCTSVNEQVTLSTSTATGWNFSGWSGAICSDTAGPGTCTVSMGGALRSPRPTPTSRPRPPRLTPAAGRHRRNQTLSMGATATDNWGVTRVEFYRDGALRPTTDTTAPYAFDYDIGNAAHGSTVTLGARSFDRAGQSSGDLATRTYTIDRTGLRHHRRRHPGRRQQGAGHLGSARVHAFRRQERDLPVLGQRGRDEDPFTSGLTVSGEGVKDVSVTATDDLGNTGTDTRRFTLDVTVPTVDIVSGPAEGEVLRVNSTRFGFAATGGAVSCSLDSETAFGPCSGEGIRIRSAAWPTARTRSACGWWTPTATSSSGRGRSGWTPRWRPIS